MVIQMEFLRLSILMPGIDQRGSPKSVDRLGISWCHSLCIIRLQILRMHSCSRFRL